jgi:hypothetical protein
VGLSFRGSDGVAAAGDNPGMPRTKKVELSTALNTTFKLVRILLAHELETGRLSARRLRQLASEIEERAVDSRDKRDHASADLLRHVVESTIQRLQEQRRLPTA